MSTRKKATTATEAEAQVAQQKAEMEPVPQASSLGAESTTAIAVVDSTALQVSDAGDFGYEGEAGGGHEGRRAEDNFVPRLSILQGLSQAVQDCRDGSIRAGMILDSMTGAVYDGEKGVEMVLSIYQTAWVEWIPREPHGGGYVGVHPWTEEWCRMAADKAKADNGGKLVPRVPTGRFTEDGKPTEIVETTTAFGHTLENGMISPFSLAFKSTHLKAIKQITSACGNFRIDRTRDKDPLPLFAFRVRMKTRLETFGKNKAFVPYFEPAVAEGPGPAVEYDADGKRTFIPNKPGRKGLGASLVPTSSPLYAMAKKLRDDVRDGIKKVDHAADEQVGGKGAADDAEIPF